VLIFKKKETDDDNKKCYYCGSKEGMASTIESFYVCCCQCFNRVRSNDQKQERNRIIAEVERRKINYQISVDEIIKRGDDPDYKTGKRDAMICLLDWLKGGQE
jgi:hypothetical protein